MTKSKTKILTTGGILCYYNYVGVVYVNYSEVLVMKREYSKPELNTKAYAQFENVFTACDKGNPDPQGCYSDQYEHPSTGRPFSAAYNSNGST